MILCFKCNSVEVQEEFQRCPSCEVSHQELVKQLDSRPKIQEKKVKEKLYPVKEMKGGVQVTTWVDAETAQINGMKV